MPTGQDIGGACCCLLCIGPACTLGALWGLQSALAASALVKCGRRHHRQVYMSCPCDAHAERQKLLPITMMVLHLSARAYHNTTARGTQWKQRLLPESHGPGAVRRGGQTKLHLLHTPRCPNAPDLWTHPKCFMLCVADASLAMHTLHVLCTHTLLWYTHVRVATSSAASEAASHSRAQVCMYGRGAWQSAPWKGNF